MDDDADVCWVNTESRGLEYGETGLKEEGGARSDRPDASRGKEAPRIAAFDWKGKAVVRVIMLRDEKRGTYNESPPSSIRLLRAGNSLSILRLRACFCIQHLVVCQNPIWRTLRSFGGTVDGNNVQMNGHIHWCPHMCPHGSVICRCNISARRSRAFLARCRP